MKKVLHLGSDAHKESVAVATAPQGSPEVHLYPPDRRARRLGRTHHETRQAGLPTLLPTLDSSQKNFRSFSKLLPGLQKQSAKHRGSTELSGLVQRRVASALRFAPAKTIRSSFNVPDAPLPASRRARYNQQWRRALGGQIQSKLSQPSRHAFLRLCVRHDTMLLNGALAAGDALKVKPRLSG